MNKTYMHRAIANQFQMKLALLEARNSIKVLKYTVFISTDTFINKPAIDNINAKKNNME